MDTKIFHRVSVYFCVIAMGICAKAQVVVDSSFGNAGALTGPNFKIPDTLGKAMGGNLFHSFSEFSLQSGQSATFTGPDSIQNILGRVTGSKVSEIDGLIKSEIADANLYLLNPNGFLFGKDAKVNVDGAFTLSTRGSLKLGEDGSFNAVNPDQSVFTSAAPNAFGFLGENPGGAIKFSGSKLVVENPVNLVGGDIRMDDSVIYSKSEGKPTRVRVEGDNLSIVDSQIRNKSTVDVGGVKQGIAIELSGDLEITDTTITEADGSGVDRGDFIDEIGSDVPFSNKVGVLGLTEGIENSDPLTIKTKDIHINGGGVYSVNYIAEGKMSLSSSSSAIEINASSINIEHGSIENHNKTEEKGFYSETIQLEWNSSSLKPSKTPYDKVDSYEVFLDGNQLFEGVDYVSRYNSRGVLTSFKFTPKLKKGSTVSFVSRPLLKVSPTEVSLNVAGNAEIGKGSTINADQLEVDAANLLLNNSRFEGNRSINVNSSGEISLDNQSLVRSDLFEKGNINLMASDVKISGNSGLLSSHSIEVVAGGKVDVSGNSYLRIRSKRPKMLTEYLFNVYWDGESGEIFDSQGELYNGKTRTLRGVKRKVANTGAHQVIFYNDGSADREFVSIPEDMVNVIDVNNPYDIEINPHIHITSKDTLIDQSMFGSQFRAFYSVSTISHPTDSSDRSKIGVEGVNPTALKIDSTNLIKFSGDSSINGFSQVGLKSDTVNLFPGLKFDSHLAPGETYDWDTFMRLPTAGGMRSIRAPVRDPVHLVINSNGSTDLIGQSLNGSVVVYAGKDINIIDTKIRTNDADSTIDWWNNNPMQAIEKTSGGLIKLQAEGDLIIDSGELGVSPLMEANRIKITGRNVNLKNVGTKNNMGIVISATDKVVLEGPTKIESKVLGNQKVAIEAPEVHLDNGAKIIVWSDIDYKGTTGGLEIDAKNFLNLKKSSISVGAVQLWGETPRLELFSDKILMDDSTVDQFSLYSYIDRAGEKYSDSSHRELWGYKSTVLEGKSIVSLVNNSSLSTSNGDIDVKSKDITISNSKITSENIRPEYWPHHAGYNNGERKILLDASKSVSLVDSRISGYTLSENGRMKIKIDALNFESIGSSVSITDEIKGRAGLISIDARNGINLENSQIVSIAEAQIANDTNGNNIRVSTRKLTMNNSIINGIVYGDGRRVNTLLSVPDGGLSLEDSYIGGLRNDINGQAAEELATDGTIGILENFGNADEIMIPSGHGEIHGANLYHSFDSMDISSGQVVTFDVPENVQNLFVRITGDASTFLNGVVKSNANSKNHLAGIGCNLFLINENGFELGPDSSFNDFSDIKLGAVNGVDFTDGKTFNASALESAVLSDQGQIEVFSPERLTGEIKLFGTSLKDDHSFEDIESSSNISLYGDGLTLTAASAVTSSLGANINLRANKISIDRFSALNSISPQKADGGDVNIKTGMLNLNEGKIRATSLGGSGGGINIESENTLTKSSVIEVNNFPIANKKSSHPLNSYQTGDIKIIANNEFSSDEGSIFVNSYTLGGAGNVSIVAGTFIGAGQGEGAGAVPFGRFEMDEHLKITGDGPDEKTSTDLWVMAYEGKAGNIQIDAEKFDSRQFRIVNVAINDRRIKLDESDKIGYGDITINAKDIDLKSFVAASGTDRSLIETQLNLNAKDDINIGEICLFTWLEPRGQGTDVNFTAGNILSKQDPLKLDPLYYPTIEHSGSVHFIAEGDLELGVLNFRYVNNSPNVEVVNEFKAERITFGLQRDSQSLSAASVTFGGGLDSSKNYKTIIAANNDISFLSNVEMKVPSLELSARNLNIYNSVITVGSLFGSEISAKETILLDGGSYIQSLSPVGKSGNPGDPSLLMINSGRLVLGPDSYILAANLENQFGYGDKDNHPVANMKIQTGSIYLDRAFISSKSSNAANAGSLEVISKDILFDNQSTLGSYSFGSGESGDISVVSNSIVMNRESAIENGINQSILENEDHLPYSPGNSGDIYIASDIIRMDQGSYIRNAQIDNAISGSVSIISDELSLDNNSFVSTETFQMFQSNFSNKIDTDQNGSVTIKAGSLDLSDSSYVKTTTVIPKRNAGDITIDAETLSLSGRSSMLSNTEPNPFDIKQGIKDSEYGNAGRLEIEAGSLELSDQSKISSDSFTNGDGGDVNLTATGISLANRSAIYAGALGQGEGGRIAIDTGAMDLRGKSAVVADVRDSGNGGEVRVNTATLEMDESLIYGSTSGAGAGSQITVNADAITLQNGARIESAASAEGAAGALAVQSGTVTIRGEGEGFDPKDIEGGETGETVASGLLTSTVGSGNAGTIDLSAERLEMESGLIGSASTGGGAAGSVGLRVAGGASFGEGARVSVSSSQSDGGDIEIESAGEISLARSELTASAAKDGGSIRLLGTGDRSIRDSRLSAEAGQDGGNITISKPGLLFMNRGQLSANAVLGKGGYISVVADTFLPSIDSLITASSEYGAQGVVEIESVETDIGGGLVILPDELKDRSVNLAERCALQLKGEVSSFFINGQGGLPVWSRENYLPETLYWSSEEE